ncbi:MAG: efflux RND transporter periplasmic adaptor subunit [Chitinivibrionales bacterium]|nr:efflux RND transporter periplasmic adaptor subunit [Chitinivibrionales bacterium]
MSLTRIGISKNCRETGGIPMNKLRVLALAGLVFACGCRSPKDKKREDTQTEVKAPTPVEAIVVSKSTLSKIISASGVAQGIREATVVAETRGKIRSVQFRLGQYVKKGQLLVQVEESVQKAGYEQAKKAREAAEMNLRVIQKLYDEGNASEGELTGAQAQMTTAQAALESAQKVYNDCRIIASIAGYIAHRDASVETGNYLAAGTPVARIVNISSLKTTVPVGELEIGLLKTGARADILVPAIGDTLCAGKVTAIAAGSDPATGSYPVEIVWNNTRDRKIKSGMSVRVTIHTQSEDSVILAPSGAVVEKDRKDAVFVNSHGKATVRFVTLGRNSGNNVEIINGLDVGNVLLTSGMTSLGRGDSIIATVKNRPEAPDEHR